MALGSASSAASSMGESDSQMEGVTNGVKHVTINGDTMTNGKQEQEEDVEDDDQFDPGMKLGFKNLYSGKEDKKGRFQWQDTIPEDIGDPVENSETAKWALLVRNIKVYNDPRKVLSVHSIVVQSPLLKKLLAGVLKNYPGITVGLNRLEFSGKFEPLIHRWTELQKAISKLGDATEEQRTTKQHAELLHDILVKEFKTLIDTSRDMMSKRVMNFDLLWTLYQPGTTVFSRQDGQETALTLNTTRYGLDSKGTPVFWITGRYIDWDGTKFGTQRLNVCVPVFTGTRAIGSLKAYPIDYHHDAAAVRERLIARGGKAEALAGSNYRAYHGVAWRMSSYGTKDQYNVKGRVSDYKCQFKSDD